MSIILREYGQYSYLLGDVPVYLSNTAHLENLLRENGLEGVDLSFQYNINNPANVSVVVNADNVAHLILSIPEVERVVSPYLVKI
jgi:hypothetical protein